MKKLWKKWISGLLVVAMLAANVPAEAFASMEKDASGKPTSITTAEGGRVQVEESWEEAYPYGAFLFTNSDAALTEGGEETVVSLYRLGGTSGRATAYVVYAPVVAQMTEELTAYGTAAGYGDVEISVEDALPIAQYQPVGKDPEPEPSTVRILEKEAVGEEYEAGDRALYLDGEAESFQWYVFLEDRWQLVEGATDADFVLSEDLLAKYDVRCVFVKDGERFCTDSVKGEAYEKPAEEVLPEAPEDLELAPEKTFTVTDMDPENPYAAQILELTFADGEWVKEIHVRSPENDKAQPLRFGTFTILSNNGGAIFQEASTVTLKVTDNDRDDPYTIGFVEKEITVDRAEGTATLKLHREGGGQDPITVDYETVDGSALAGKDYESVSGTAVFYADVNEVTINIPLLSNGEGGEPLDFTLALKDMKGDAAGLCTLTEEAAVVHLTNAAAGEEKAEASGEEAEDSEESGKTSGAKAAASDEEAETDAELPLPENALPYGGLSGALQEGAEAVGTEPVNGEQVVTPREELLYGEIAGLQGTGGGGPLRTYNYGQISFDEAHGGSYWTDEAYIAGKSPNTLTGWSGGWAYGNGWQIKSDRDASSTLFIEHMPQMYSDFYGQFEFNADLDNGWHWTNGYAYGWAGISLPDSWYATASSNPKFSTSSLGLKRHLSWKESGIINTSWDMKTNVRAVSLHISKVENPSDDDVYSRVTYGYLTRRVLEEKLRLRIHTANDGESGNGNVATAPAEGAALKASTGVYNGMKPEILVVENSGGVNSSGQLYVGSRLQISLKFTDSYKPYSGSAINAAVYLTRPDGSIVNAKVEPGSNGIFFVTLLWDNMTEADLSDQYTINVVMTRTQKLELNLQTSVARKVNKDGSLSDEIDPAKIGEAWDAFWENGGDSITVGYSEPISEAPHFASDRIKELEIHKTDWISGDVNPLKILDTLNNVQYVNFNRRSGDRIVFSGKMYKGDERIYLSVADLSFPKLSFLYYSESYLNRPNIMSVSINRVELYLDGDGDGRIGGSFNSETGQFVLDQDSKDTFVMYLEEDANYDEVMFEPEKLKNDKYGQYFAKTYYTMTPRSLEGSSGYAQVLPAFTTSRTKDGNYANLTKEQQSYRYILAGTDAGGTRTSDNHPMYGAEATAYQFVDAPLGGDHSPLVEKEKDVYEWNPRYVGNLLYDYDNPDPIYIEHSLAGDNYPLAEVSYDGQGGITVDEAGKANLNGYLGSFVADTTIALCVTEQRLTADELHDNPASEKTLAPESSALSRRSAAPNGAYLSKVDSGDMGGAGFDTSDSGQDYPEFNVDYDMNLPVTNETFQGLATVVTGKNTISITIAIPIYSWISKNGGSFAGKGFPKTITDPIGLATDQISAYGKGIRDGGSYDEIVKALERGGYEKTNGGGLRSGKTTVTIGFSAIFTLKYDTRENAWYLQEFAFGANASFVVKYDIRLAVCPLVYGYVSLSLSGTVTTGGTFQRTVVEGDYPIVSKGAAKTLKKGEKVEFDTPYINANIEFNGKIYIKTDAVSGEKVNNGFLTSQGGSERQLQFKSTTYSMCFDKERTTRHITIVALADTTINYLNTIESIKSELVWSGVKVAPKIQGEIGVGAGVEGLKVEAFIKTVISANFVFGQLQKDGSRKALAVDSASFSLSLAFRAVLLMMSWEIDAVGVQAKYDGKEDKWTAEYILFGKSHPLENGRGLAGAGDDAEEHLPKALDRTQTIYSSQSSNSASGGLLRAYKPDDPTVPFQLSGYNSSAEAFRLTDGLELGCDYRVVTANGANYVVYTIGRPNGQGMDTTMLALSRLVLSGEGYGQNEGKPEEDLGDGLGLVNPLDWEEVTGADGKTYQVVKAPDDRSKTPYILVDLADDGQGTLVDDGTGDLEFDVKVIGDKIHVAWVSYAKPEPAPSADTRTVVQTAAKNTVVRQAAFDVTKKEGFSQAVNLSDPEGGAAVYLPRIVDGSCTAFVRANHVDEARRAELVAKYVEKLNGLGYYEDQGSEAGRAIFEYRRTLYENALDYKGETSTLCISGNGKVSEFTTLGGSEAGYASEEPIAPIEKLAFFETKKANGGTDIYAAYTTWGEDLNSDDLANVSALYLTSFAESGEAEGTLVSPYGHAAVSSALLNGQKENDTLSVYQRRTSDVDTPGQTVETLLFVGQGGKVFLIPADRISAYLASKGTGEILEKTVFSGGDGVERTGFAFGEDGNGDLVAVYVSTVENTTNTGLFLSTFDTAERTWGAGTILAMRHMDVREDAAKYNWTDEETTQAYLGELSGYSDADGQGKGGMDQFQFSNLQIALGKKADPTGDQATDLTNANTTLTILTQGMLRYLSYEEAAGERFLVSGAEPYEGATLKEGLGVYAISYGVGQQRVGEASLSFVNEQFTAGSILTANLSFVNTGDVGIRGSKDAPITVTLSVDGDGLPNSKLATWEVTENIYSGRKVELSGDFTLPATLPENAGFCLNVSEDTSYAENPYSAALRDIYTIKKLPELGFEDSTMALSRQDNGELALDEGGNVLLDIDLFVCNRGTEDAGNVYLQFSYGTHDPKFASKVQELVDGSEDWNDVIYRPLDISGHTLTVGEEEPLLLRLFTASENDPSRGIFSLGGVRAGYGRRVRGTIAVPAAVFTMFGEDRDKGTAGSLLLVAEIFSDKDAVATDEFGLDASDHGEYDGDNNRFTSTIEHTTAFAIPKNLEVPVGTQLRLPVFFASTLGGKAPEISVAEMTDREEESEESSELLTDILNWKQKSYQNGQGRGTLILRGAKTGNSYIRILDEKTNAYQDIAVTFTDEAEGLDIINTNTLFTFYDKSGKEVTGSGSAWTFRDHVDSWRNNEKPLGGTISYGSKGSSIQFTTEAESIALDFHGKIRVNCDHPDFDTVILEDEGQLAWIDLGDNPDSEPHIVRITVLEEPAAGSMDSGAQFDRLIEHYHGKLIDKDAWEESGELDLIWGSNFPEAGSLKAGEVFDTTVYGVVEGILSTDANTYVTCEGDHVEVLSGETTEWGDYGQVYQMNVRFNGNGPATFTVMNDKCDSCQYTVDVDWWEPWASAFNLAGDPAYELYAQEYPELPEMIEKSGAATPGSPVVPVDNQWLHVKPDTGGEFVTVSIDEDAPAESFTVWVVDYEEYLETGRLPEDGAVTLLRGGSVDIPVKPDSTVLVTAEAVEKGTDSELAYTITRNDGTVETYNAGDVREHNSIVLSVKGELPEFKAQSLILTGQIGVNFYMNLPKLSGVDYEESYVEFTVSGEKTEVAFDKNAKNRDGKYYRFTCFVNSVQMADRIKAVYHYARYGEEREVEATYSVRQYVEDFEAQGGFGEKATALVHALADYGHHAQPFLSALRNWTIGMEHKEMDLYYIGSYSDDALANAREDLKSRSFTVKRASDITGASYSLHLDSGTGINLYFTPVKGYKGGVSATVDGKTCAVEKLSDGRYRVKISDIAAHKLGKTYKVVLKTKAGKTTGEVSVLSYINDALKSAQDEDKKNAMLALYRYYVAAEAYLK